MSELWRTKSENSICTIIFTQMKRLMTSFPGNTNTYSWHLKQRITHAKLLPPDSPSTIPLPPDSPFTIPLSPDSPSSRPLPSEGTPPPASSSRLVTGAR